MLLTRKPAAVAAGLLACVVLVGCGYRVSHMMMSETTYPPKPSSYEMPVLHASPERPHAVIARIFAAPRNPGDVSTWSSDKVVRLLKQRALELGADALVVTDVSMGASGTVGQGGFSGEGLAIRWTE